MSAKIYTVVEGDGVARHVYRLWQGDDIPKSAIHVCDTPTEAVILWVLHHAGVSCPRCAGPMVLLRDVAEADRRAIVAAASKWLDDPTNGYERAQNTLFWREMTWVRESALASLEGREG